MAGTQLAPLTTVQVGGPAGKYVEAASEEAVVGAVRWADEHGEDLLTIGGGSNLVIADEGYPGTVLRIATSGYSLSGKGSADNAVLLDVQAGQLWDELVEATVEQGLSGLEALSGIPGLTGATPVQNVGAYGAEVSHTLVDVRTWDRQEAAIRTFANHELGFGYRDSLLKQTTVNGSPRYVVLAVRFRLQRDQLSAPIRYTELARSLGVDVGERAPAAEVRREVLRLRASKGMVLDPADRDTFSTGSFFTNPIVAPEVADGLPADAPRWPSGEGVKLSAAWLIDRTGFSKGFGLEGTGNGTIDGFSVAGGRASLSTKHTLAITNRGDAAAADILAIGRTVRDGVEHAFGIRLHPEPLLIGCAL
ncbi:UDP-N-acetylenolpyruvoylglucosamine reductase MurB [Arthrobacter crystallopoietes BAB-32]|uniref:UDP-N-acetylenolpyruvoylglucosamine reductase n=1 Tax=Arthrobacter crystallopoietes BAB-32 TaxID=1246476 RepID=N1V0Q5_9MICC|nr:UDP-N-acetylmuramate dehydrogenase [Arthrobacter crystallopoietes]EMY33662.1 UDP-N-acetylenolpyruvoylglucosamine reductase MurB [Arthrobacter crystallopoietes BAB-32]